MSRLIAVLFTVVAVLVAFWISGRDPDREIVTTLRHTAEPDGASATKSGGGAPLVSPDGDRSTVAPRAAEWRVEVRGAEGGPVPEAQLVATKRDERLDAVGGALWSRPLAGVWTLEVTAPGVAAWRRDITLTKDRSQRTVVVLGAPLRVSGRVRDSVGTPRPYHLVGFVPLGGPAPTVPREWLDLPHGRTGVDGEFEAALPPGTWRLFVGYGGKIVFEDVPTTIEPDGVRRVEIVVPAPTRLLAEVVEAPGVERTTGHGFSVYRREELVDAERPVPTFRPALSAAEQELDDESAAEAAAVEGAIEAERARREAQIAADGGVDLEAQRAERRRSVVPEGWRMERSGFCDAKNRMQLEGIPAGEELRFAASRGQEAFRVVGSGWLVAGRTLHVRIELPAPLPTDAPEPTEPRAVQALIEELAPEGEPLEPGATWR